jgi:hypothetical protein
MSMPVSSLTFCHQPSFFSNDIILFTQLASGEFPHLMFYGPTGAGDLIFFVTSLLLDFCSLVSDLCSLHADLLSLLSALYSLLAALCHLLSTISLLLADRCSLLSALCSICLLSALLASLFSLLSALCSLLHACCSLLLAYCFLLSNLCFPPCSPFSAPCTSFLCYYRQKKWRTHDRILPGKATRVNALLRALYGPGVDKVRAQNKSFKIKNRTIDVSRE